MPPLQYSLIKLADAVYIKVVYLLPVIAFCSSLYFETLALTLVLSVKSLVTRKLHNGIETIKTLGRYTLPTCPNPLRNPTPRNLPLQRPHGHRNGPHPQRIHPRPKRHLQPSSPRYQPH